MRKRFCIFKFRPPNSKMTIFPKERAVLPLTDQHFKNLTVIKAGLTKNKSHSSRTQLLYASSIWWVAFPGCSPGLCYSKLVQCDITDIKNIPFCIKTRHMPYIYMKRRSIELSVFAPNYSSLAFYMRRKIFNVVSNW